MALPAGQGEGTALPDRALVVNGRRYFTDNWTRGAYDNRGNLSVWIEDEQGLLKPIVCIGELGVSNWIHQKHYANWDVLNAEPYRSLWSHHLLAGSVCFLWTDRNGDGQIRPEEFQFLYRTRVEPQSYPHPIDRIVLDADFRKTLGRFWQDEAWPWKHAVAFGPWTLGPDLALINANGFRIPCTFDDRGLPRYDLDTMQPVVPVNTA